MTPYGAVLSEAWADHLAPRAAGAPTVVSLFAGCGGSSLGYSMAGYRELLAVEWDEHAAHVFTRNFPAVPVHVGDIADVDTGAITVPLDVLDGSPPCQGFSTAGARRSDDPRNDLFLQYVRLLEAWRPRALVMENVSGMVKGKMRLKFAEVLAALKGAGYRVTARLLDASLLGVPQRRRRMVFVGVRDDLALDPVHPRPGLRPMTVREGWADLDGPGEVPALSGTKIHLILPYVTPGTNAAKALLARNRKGNFFNLIRASWNRPAPTVVKTFGATCSMLHPAEDRYLGSRELTRLQSFPDEFDWGVSTYTQLHARVGNSVPPLMMRAVAATLREQILDAAPVA